MTEDMKLWKKYKKHKTKALREELIKKYLFLVKYVAGRVAINLPPNIEIGDLISYGILGLFDAIEKFDMEQGNKFETYAVSRIRGAIIDELRKLDWAPRLLRKKAKQLEKKCRELEDKLGRPPSDKELADSLGVSVDELNSIYGELSSTSFLSLDDVWQNDEGNKPISRIQTVGDSLIDNQRLFLQKNESKEIIAQTLNELPEKERLVMVLYYYENLTLKEIGSVLNVSESRACQIHSKVIFRLRSMLKKKLGDTIEV